MQEKVKEEREENDVPFSVHAVDKMLPGQKKEESPTVQLLADDCQMKSAQCTHLFPQRLLRMSPSNDD